MVSKVTCLFQGQMIYEAIGLYPAELYFTVEENSGQIKVIENIKEDPLRLSSYTVSTSFNAYFLNMESL